MRVEHLVQYILPFLGALTGVAVFCLAFRDNWAKVKAGDTVPILVILVSLLCTAYGVERLTYSSEIDQIRERLEKVPSATFLSTKSEIWSSARKLMLGVEQNIRAVQSGDRPNELPQGYEGFPDQLRGRFAAQHEQLGGAVKYRVVLVVDGPKRGEELAAIERANAVRLDAYEKAGLGDVVELRMFDRKPLAKFDITIVDTQHAIIGFDTAQGKSKDNVEIQNAMIWENHPAIAQKLASWFDNTVWPNATPYKIWLAEQKQSP